NIFLEINAILNGEQVNRANFYLFYDYFSSYSVQNLHLLKWILTIFFIIIMGVATLLALHLWYNEKYFDNITTWFYLIVIGVLFLLVVVTKTIGVFNDIYSLLRSTIGFLQSPLPLFILFSMYFYLDKSVDIRKIEK